MRYSLRGHGLFLAATILFLAAGCGVNTTFVYKPSAPPAGIAKLPVKIAVLPFKDGTENFTKRGSIGIWNTASLEYNLAKYGQDGVITALTPYLWAKAFADEMAASGAFRAVRFVYNPSELTDEEFSIEGTVEKASSPGDYEVNPYEFTLGLRALRRADNRPVWEKEVARVWKIQKGLYDGCRGVQCQVDRHHEDTNRVMREMFAEARADLVATLGSFSGSHAGEGGLPPVAGEGARPGTSPPPAPESTEQTIERILKGK